MVASSRQWCGAFGAPLLKGRFNRDDAVHAFGTLYGRLDVAVARLEQLAKEGDQTQDWEFLTARLRELEQRIAVITDDVTVSLMARKGLYRPVLARSA